MKPANPNSPDRSSWGVAAGFIVLALSRILFLRAVPGFHYDEAWAALFAHRIATNLPHFWPVQAMSPYTSAWGHFIAALFFSLFGTSLFVYRASQVGMALAGAGLLTHALWRLGEKEGAALLPWILAFSPVLAVNERFAIDLTTFHVFCLGLLAWGVSALGSRKKLALALISLACLLGLTSHVLFAGVILSLEGAYLLSSPPEKLETPEKLLIATIALGSALFFTKIFFAIPEKDKALALCLGWAVSLAFVCLPRARQVFEGRRIRMLTRTALWALGLPGWIILVFFSEGSWATLFHTGKLNSPFLVGSTLLPPALTLLVRARRDARAHFEGSGISQKFMDFWSILVLLTVVLATKPAPRYFELPLILGAVFFSICISRLKARWRCGIMALWGVSGSLSLAANYFLPQLRGEPKNTAYRFFLFHDTTSDTLNTQKLARSLATRGCGYGQLKTQDMRLQAELQFLAWGDWKPDPTPCACGRTFRLEKAPQSSAQNLRPACLGGGAAPFAFDLKPGG